ncbi:MAG: hypothetical protein AVDCRST_MAG42-735 [uncultured Chthoniobacterales bacterium]|uniref:Uncharacterized protein n=1 Tax=uncultured Chthoniobacterales bacterium TaxID=1836801 RepID=A0A6J4HJT5_9BACT|nr:MAG: hypothetical protein AVDCRST_MAG42-735 [uncultured Chthoniobacterales bacterium]
MSRNGARAGADRRSHHHKRKSRASCCGDGGGLRSHAHADAAARDALGLPSAVELADGERFAPGLTAVAVEGAPAGEIAIYAEAEGGSLVIGDALINMGSYGLALTG